MHRKEEYEELERDFSPGVGYRLRVAQVGVSEMGSSSYGGHGMASEKLTKPPISSFFRALVVVRARSDSSFPELAVVVNAPSRMRLSR